MQKRRSTPPQLTLTQRSFLAVALVALFDAWKLTDPDRCALLGLEPDQVALVQGLRRTMPLPSSELLYAHIGYVQAVGRHLPKLYPGDRQLADSWMTTVNPDLGHRTPLELVARQGLQGLRRLDTHLRRRLAHTNRAQLPGRKA